VTGWTRFRAAQEWLDRNMPPTAAVSQASGAVAAPAPSGAAAAPGPMSREEEVLYKQFLEWRAARAKAGR
jgi:hypothetical protein